MQIETENNFKTTKLTILAVSEETHCKLYHM